MKCATSAQARASRSTFFFGIASRMPWLRMMPSTMGVKWMAGTSYLSRAGPPQATTRT